MSPTGSAHILGRTVAPYFSLGVRLRTTIIGTFVLLLWGAVKLNGGWPRTFPTGCVRTLGSPVVPCTLGVRFRVTHMLI